MMYWQIFLECPRCDSRHDLVRLEYNPMGDAKVSAQCCGKTIQHDLTIEDIIAGATQQEEAHLMKTPDGRKRLTKLAAMEN